MIYTVYDLFVYQVKIVGVEPFDANAMALSLHHGQRIMLDKVGGFADGVAVKVVGQETFRLCKELIDGVVLVNRDAICASIKVSFKSFSVQELAMVICLLPDSVIAGVLFI